MSRRKKLLAAVRSGNYAHAGEEEAIEITFQSIPKKADQILLDVGCGLGGTAEYLRKNGWGNVVGVDIDSAAIEFIRKNYPQISAHVGDASKVDRLFSRGTFDTVFSLNAFFTFDDQETTLKALYQVCKTGGNLVLFDYSTSSDGQMIHPFINPRTKYTMGFYPLHTKKIVTLLENTGWQHQQTVDLTPQYLRWYQELTSKMDAKKTDLVAEFGAETFDDLYEGYSLFLDQLNKGLLGGTVVLASK